MFEKIRNVLVKKAEEDLAQYEKISSELEDVERKLSELNNKLLSTTEKINDYHEMRRAKKRLKLYSFFEKNVTKRNEYHKDRVKEKQFDENEYEELSKSLPYMEEQIKQLEIKKEELIKKKESIYDIKACLEVLKKAKTIKDLNISFEEIITLLKKEGISFTLGEEDKMTPNNSSDLYDDSNLLLVHKTRYIPRENVVRSGYLNGGMRKVIVNLPGQDFSFEYPYARNTIHFCINGEVKSHLSGYFDKRRYAVIIPYKLLEKKNLKALREEDTYFDGTVDISGGYILCPKNEVKKISEENPNAIVVGYEGECVDGYAEAFIRILGYESNDIDPLMGAEPKYVLSREGAGWCAHGNSPEYIRDETLQRYYEIIGFIEEIISYQKNNNDCDLRELLYSIYNSKSITYSDGMEFEDREDIPASIYEFIWKSKQYDRVASQYLEEIINGKYSYNQDNTCLPFLLRQLLYKYYLNISEDVLKLMYSIIAREDLDDGVKFIVKNIKDDRLKKDIMKLIEEGKIDNVKKIVDFIFFTEVADQISMNYTFNEKISQ